MYKIISTNVHTWNTIKTNGKKKIPQSFFKRERGLYGRQAAYSWWQKYRIITMNIHSWNTVKKYSRDDAFLACSSKTKVKEKIKQSKNLLSLMLDTIFMIVNKKEKKHKQKWI
jgi:hypothetical protein